MSKHSHRQLAANHDAAPVRRVPARKKPRHQPLGEILVEMGDLTPIEQLRTVAMQNRVQARFGDILDSGSQSQRSALEYRLIIYNAQHRLICQLSCVVVIAVSP